MTALKLDYIKYSFWTHSSAQHQHLLFALKRTIEFKAWKVWIHNYGLWILYINETVFSTVSHLASLFTETLNDVDTVRQWIKLGSDWVFLAIGQKEVLCVVQRVSHLAKSHHNTSNNWQLFLSKWSQPKPALCLISQSECECLWSFAWGHIWYPHTVIPCWISLINK